MHIGFLTDGLGHLALDDALDVVQGLGLTEIELATGNWSPAPHVDLDELLLSQARRDELLASAAAHGVRIGALNASGNALHPESGGAHDRVVRATMQLAPLLGVDKIVMMSGLPAVFPGDRVAPWITTCWPYENGENLERQWHTAAAYWKDLAPFAADHGIQKIAVEMHANQLVYNAPTLLRLREIAGEIVGANMDPSHLIWMGADPIASIAALDGAIHHVHAKDTRIEPRAATRTLLEPLFFDRREERAWNYATIGEGHPDGGEYWLAFCQALTRSGYDGVLSIEHEDVAHTPEEGLALSAGLLTDVLLQSAPALP